MYILDDSLTRLKPGDLPNQLSSCACSCECTGSRMSVPQKQTRYVHMQTDIPTLSLDVGFQPFDSAAVCDDQPDMRMLCEASLSLEHQYSPVLCMGSLMLPGGLCRCGTDSQAHRY